MFKQERNHTVDVLFVITLFCVFAISVVMLTGIGAKVYQNIVDSMSENYESRTSFTYVINKLHQNDTADSIRLGEYEGENAILILEEINNISYCTYLYHYDGHLKEMFTRYGQEFDPQLGTNILELKDFSAEQISPTLLKFTITTPNDGTETLFVHINTDKE